MKKIGALVAAGALIVAAPAVAQQHGQNPGEMHGMHGGQAAMQHCAGMAGGGSVGMVLQHRDHLELTPDQVTRLENVQEEAHAAARSHMEQALSARTDATRSLEGEEPDFDAYEAALRDAADHGVQARVAMARHAAEARALLTPDQREKLAELSQATGGMMGGMTGGMGHAGGAMHQGMQHTGMDGMSSMDGMDGMGGMMDCPMMQGPSDPGPADAG